MRLGDKVEQALSAVGVTQERVTKFLGHECGCGERKEKLNQLGAWASRVLRGKTEDANGHLDDILSNPVPRGGCGDNPTLGRVPSDLVSVMSAGVRSPRQDAGARSGGFYFANNERLNSALEDLLQGADMFKGKDFTFSGSISVADDGRVQFQGSLEPEKEPTPEPTPPPEPDEPAPIIVGNPVVLCQLGEETVIDLENYIQADAGYVVEIESTGELALGPKIVGTKLYITASAGDVFPRSLRLRVATEAHSEPMVVTVEMGAFDTVVSWEAGDVSQEDYNAVLAAMPKKDGRPRSTRNRYSELESAVKLERGALLFPMGYEVPTMDDDGALRCEHVVGGNSHTMPMLVGNDHPAMYGNAYLKPQRMVEWRGVVEYMGTMEDYDDNTWGVLAQMHPGSHGNLKPVNPLITIQQQRNLMRAVVRGSTQAVPKTLTNNESVTWPMEVGKHEFVIFYRSDWTGKDAFTEFWWDGVKRMTTRESNAINHSGYGAGKPWMNLTSGNYQTSEGDNPTIRLHRQQLFVRN